MQNYLPTFNFQSPPNPLTTQTIPAEFSHESGFFVPQINPYVQPLYKLGMTSLSIQLRGKIREIREM
jgi:hypothetical protein